MQRGLTSCSMLPSLSMALRLAASCMTIQLGCPDVPCQTLSTSCREQCREVTRLPSDIHLLERTHMHT